MFTFSLQSQLQKERRSSRRRRQLPLHQQLLLKYLPRLVMLSAIGRSTISSRSLPFATSLPPSLPASPLPASDPFRSRLGALLLMPCEWLVISPMLSSPRSKAKFITSLPRLLASGFPNRLQLTLILRRKLSLLEDSDQHLITLYSSFSPVSALSSRRDW